MNAVDPENGSIAEKRVYVDTLGKLLSFRPRGARKFAKRLRASGLPEMIQVAGDQEALSLEIEQGEGTA